MNGPIKVGRIRRIHGIAGNFVLSALVWYEGDEKPYRVSFHGSTYGSPGPIVVVTDSGQEFVKNASRYGAKLDEQWIRNFYGMETGK